MAFDNRSDRHVVARREIKVTPKPVVETDFAEQPDGTLLDSIEDPNNPGRALLAVYRDESVHYANQFETEDQIFLPISRTTEILRYVRFSRGAKPYKSTDHLLGALYAAIAGCLNMSDSERVLISCFILSTWLFGKLPVAPYLAFVGLPRSGKTTTLRLLDLLCRRSLFTSDITSASFYATCNLITPTMIIDETATAGDWRANRQGCSLCSDLKNQPPGANESTAEPQKTVPPGGPQIGEREHGELKTE